MTFSTTFETITQDLKTLELDFRINDLDESLEVFIKGEWARLTDTLEAVIKSDLRDIGYGTKQKPSLSAAKDAWTKIAHVKRYNPIKEYFKSLEGKYEPNGQNTPYVNELFSKFFTNPDGYFGRWLFRWQCGVIAKVFQRARNPMLVWVGGQGVGKSRLARWLCPIDPYYYFVEGTINPDAKDHKLRLADSLIWEAPELGATTRRADVEALKAFITLRDISERPPYGRYPIHKPTCCSFIGSVNDDGAGFLNDPTGSTRFLACELHNIDFSYTIQNVNQLWAEAYWFYKNHPKIWELPDTEQQAQAHINTSFEMVSALEEIILDRFAFTENYDDYVSNKQIKNHILGHYTVRNENGFLRELNRIMKKHGACKARSKYQPGKRHESGFRGIKRIYPDDTPPVEKKDVPPPITPTQSTFTESEA